MNDTRTFHITYSLFGEDVTYATIELDQAVIDVVDDDWREHLYQLFTPEEIAEHICYNIVKNHLQLSQMDGWADMDNSMVRMLEWPDFDFGMEAVELKE